MRRTGTTLTEVMLAIAILAVAMMPIFHMMSASNTASRMQKVEGVAANLAKEEMNRWMYVLDPGNFPDDGDEHLVNVFNIEGNEIEIKVRVYRHGNTSTNVKYPEFDWHDFRTSCGGGREGNDLTGMTHDRSRPIQEVTRDEDRTFRLVDIVMIVRWRTPNTAWSDVNRFYLLSRRGYM